MDLSTQQVTEIQQIEKQIEPTTEPKIISEKVEKGHSVLVNLLAALGISGAALAAVILILFFPFSKKQQPSPTVTTSTVQVASSPNIVVETQYVNPFSTAAQYQNPFTLSQNPFSTLSQ